MGVSMGYLGKFLLFMYIASCSVSPQTNEDASVKYVNTASEVDGVVKVNLANINSEQVIKSSGDELGDIEALFSPGTLSVPMDISFEKGTNLVNQSTLTQLGIGGEATSVADSVVMTPSVEKNPLKPITLSLSVPASLNLNAAYPTIFYRTKDYATGKVYTGVIDSDLVTFDAGKMKFETKLFGMFQTAYISEKVEAAEAESNFGIETEQLSGSIPPFEVYSRKPVILKEGETVTIKGKYFVPSLTLASNDTGIENFQVVDSTTIKFTLAQNTSFGQVDFALASTADTQNMNLYYLGSANDYPIINLLPAAVCSGQQYYDENGTLQIGTKNCGAPATCTSDGEIGCLTDSSFPAVDVTSVVSSKIVIGQSILGVAGSASAEVHSDCTADGVVGCVTTATYKSADTTSVITTDLKAGKTFGGVVGALNNCSADGEAGCVTVASFPSAALPNTGDIKSGVTIAGITGTLVNSTPADCSADGETGCVTVAAFPAVDNAFVAANVANMRTSLTIASNTGTIPDCTGDNETLCYTTVSNPAVIKANVVGANIRTGNTIAGVAGTILDCSGDNEASCYTTASNPAVVKANVLASEIRTGNTVAGVTGTILDCTGDNEASCYTTATNPAVIKANVVGANIRTGNTIAGVSGTILDCSGDNEASCYTTATNPAVVKANVDPAKMRGMTVAGVPGTLPDCTNDGDISCYIAGSFVAADSGAYSATDIKSGITIGGISGSIANCSVDGDSNCVVDGATMIAADMAFAQPHNIRHGFQIGGQIGSIKTRCNNFGNASIYDPNIDTFVTTDETLDDWNNGGANGPLVNPWGPAENCGPADWADEGVNLAGGAAGCDDPADECVMRDKISGLRFTSSNHAGTSVAGAVSDCQAKNTAVYGGVNTWRLPTQKELLQAYVHGIANINNPNFISAINDANGFWTSTTDSIATADGIYVWLHDGLSATAAKTAAGAFLCVSN